MLNLKNYGQEIEEIEPGQTIRLNHVDCDAGEDTRRRLYITRTHADETKVVAYCHNCQQGGIRTTANYSTYRDDKHRKPRDNEETVSDNVEEPVGLVGQFNHWPADAHAWALQRNLSQVDFDWYGIKYDPSSDRIYIPKYHSMDRRKQNQGKLVGYQLRNLGNYGPKYITVNEKDAKNWMYIHPDQCECDWAVIVEDMVSAIHILKATANIWNDGGNKPGVFVNYGTKVDPTLMYVAARNHKWATVWLDNDNQHVLNQAKMMQRTIAMYNGNIKVGRVEGYDDPKYHQHEEICRILEEVDYGQY